MVRKEWCRENIDQIIEKCGLKDRAARNLKKAKDFTTEYPLLSPYSSVVVLAVARLPKKQVKAVTQEILNQEKIVGDWKVTEKAVKEIINRVTQYQNGTIVPPTTEEGSEKSTAAPEGGKKEATPTDTKSDEEIAGPCPGPEAEYLLSHSRSGKLVWKKKPVPKVKEPTCKEILTVLKADYPEIYERIIAKLEEIKQSI